MYGGPFGALARPSAARYSITRGSKAGSKRYL